MLAPPIDLPWSPMIFSTSVPFFPLKISLLEMLIAVGNEHLKIGLKFVISHLCQIGGSSHTGVTRWSILCKKDLCTAKRFGFHSNKTFPAFWKTAAALRRNGSRGKRGVFKNTENSSIVNQILECSNFSSKTNWMLIDDKDNNWISLKTILNHDQLKVFKIWNFN